MPADKHTGRYFHIYPDGKTHVFLTGKDGFPTQFPTGNIGKNFDSVIQNLQWHNLEENDVR